MITSSEKVIEVDLAANEDEVYLEDHKVDGCVHFPAAEYIMLAWKVLANRVDKPFEDVPVVIEDVTFHRAITMDKISPVRFHLSVLRTTGEFEISEGGTVVSSGRIRQAEKDHEHVDTDLPSMRNNEVAYELEAEDIYTEFRLRGYEYGRSFQGIIKADMHQPCGKVKWEDSWLTFMDAMLQFTVLSASERTLRLPVGIKTCSIEPLLHKEIVEKTQKAGVDVFYDKGSMKCSAGGIVIDGAMFTTLLRRTMEQTAALYEYKFVPYIDNECSKKEREVEVLEYVKVCNHLARQVLQTSGTKTAENLEDFTDGCEPPEEMVLRYLDCAANNQGLLRVLTTVQDQANNLNLGSTLQTAMSAFQPDLQKDRLNTALFEEDPFRHLLDVVVENTSVKKLRVVEVATASALSLLAATACNFLSKSNTVLNVDYTVAHSSPSKLTSEQVPKGIKIIAWNLSSASKIQLPEADLFVLWVHITEKECLEPFLEQMSPLCKNQEFVLVSVRTRLIPAEMILPAVSGVNLSIYTVEKLESLFRFSGFSLVRCMFNANFKGLKQNINLCFTDPALNTLLSQDLVMNVYRDGYWGSFRFAGTLSRDPQMKVTEFAFLNAGVQGELSSIQWHESSLGYVANDDSMNLCRVYYTPIMATDVMPTITNLQCHTRLRSKDERQFLIRRFPGMDEENISSSHDVCFQQYMDLKTKGRGVDLVLNSSAEESLRAGARCLAPRGRFLEIGKAKFSEDSALQMFALPKGVTFHDIVLQELIDDSPLASEERHRVVSLMQEGITSGAVRPMQSILFSLENADRAFRLTASENHREKVLLEIRPEEIERTVMTAKPLTVEAVPHTCFYKRKSYILVGGLGGFGLELVDWMVSRGCRHLLLSSRSGVRTGYQKLCLRRWLQAGVNIVTTMVDASTHDGAHEIVSKAAAMAPVGGIFNLAVALRDGLLEKQTVENFETVFSIKINGTKHLENISRQMCPDLDHFICFSSLAAGLGNVGQTNYGCANSAMERICERRAADGLPALAIQWGPIADVGVLRKIFGDDAAVSGVITQRITSCLAVMEQLMCHGRTVVCSFVKADFTSKEDATKKPGLVDSLGRIFGVKDPSSLNPNATFRELGMDSIMAVLVKYGIEREWDFTLTMEEIGRLTFNELRKMTEASCSSEWASGDTATAEVTKVLPPEN